MCDKLRPFGSEVFDRETQTESAQARRDHIEYNRNMKQKDILIVFILLFIFVIAWTVSSFYRSAVSSTITEAIIQDIPPIEPTFDTKTINRLKEREKITPSFELGNPIVPQSSATEGGEIRP